MTPKENFMGPKNTMQLIMAIHLIIYFHVNWLRGYTSPYGYSRQPVLLLHLYFLFVVIFSYKCKSTLKVVVVVIQN